MGLSPRVRGNPGLLELSREGLRSIPARAGEPRAWWIRPWQSGVYPRACGGTAADFHKKQALCGLSPRVRGNPPVGFAPWGV